ncbi:histone-lysine N-methyltransferase SETMAR [Trichonephila clavipes]|nr:histone-lysine N-methyltransferase SETMAR [Trichonephila clavipes]
MMVRVYEDRAPSMKCVHEWFERFREGRESVSDYTRSGRQMTSVSDEDIVKFLAKNEVVQIEHPPYSPDLNPLDSFLFLQLKLTMKEKKFDDIPDIQRNVTRLLNFISKEDFLQSFQDLHSRSQG